MVNRRVLYLGPDTGLDAVRRGLGPGFDVDPAPPQLAAVRAQIAEADVVLDASMKVPLRAELVEAASRLRLVITATTGADHIDRTALEARGVPLLTLAGQTEVLSRVTPAVELAWMLLMAVARRLRPAMAHVEEGGWDRTRFPGTMLRGRTLGVVGCGRLGTWMARYGRAFGMHVLGADPHADPWPDGIEPAALDGLLERSDFVSLHVHLTEDTRGLLDRARVERMKPGAVLVNTSRGAVVDEEALVDGLRADRLGGVGADVVWFEPEVERSPLWQHARVDPRCVITPHIGGFSPDALDMVLEHTGRRVRDHFEGTR